MENTSRVSMKVAAYLNGIPASNSNEEKPKMLKEFIAGVNKFGDEGILISLGDPVYCDVAVIQGFVHEHSKTSPHLRLRREVLEFQKKNNKRTIIIDSNLFLYKSALSQKKYFRFSYDGVFPSTGEYCNKESSANKWLKIKKDLGIDLKPWRLGKGDYILLCLQRNGGWSMGNNDVGEWATNLIKEIKRYSNLPIRVRPHPGDKNSLAIALRLGVSVSDTISLEEDLANAYACITYNSSPGVAGVIEGVPTFALDPIRSQAASVSHHSLSQLENLVEFDRTQWIQDIAQCHWSFEEMHSGEAWAHMRQWAVQ